MQARADKLEAAAAAAAAKDSMMMQQKMIRISQRTTFKKHAAEAKAKELTSKADELTSKAHHAKLMKMNWRRKIEWSSKLVTNGEKNQKAQAWELAADRLQHASELASK